MYPEYLPWRADKALHDDELLSLASLFFLVDLGVMPTTDMAICALLSGYSLPEHICAVF